MKKQTGLSVVVSERENNGIKWRVVSSMQKNRRPSGKEMKEVKRIFFGAGKKAKEIPPEQLGGNVNPNTVHLRCNMNG